ncbi:MAG TPA: tail fiber protein [Pyrinomonadaceae bacterium]|jgi:microcystin-dependent protein
MSEPFLGQINIFPYNFAPRGWAFCAGQILSIAQNTALFSLLGTTFGGNGQTTFALPDLRGRVANGAGQGPGLSNYDLGEVSGTENTTLTINQMPAHQHTIVVNVNSSEGGQNSPQNTFLGKTDPGIYAATSDNTHMGQQPPTGISGGSQPFSILQPFLTLNFCIALQGIFPSRN